MKTRYTLSELKAAAVGRWPAIHAALGIPAHLLDTRKHQPCPYCGGKDRYRYTNHQQQGGFICNQCTPQGGSGFDLLMLVLGITFQEAADQVAALLGFSDGAAATATRRQPLPPPKPQQPPKDKHAWLLSQWQEAQPITATSPAALYLVSRGIPERLAIHAQQIRGHIYGRIPAMLATITRPNGELMGLHYTYLQKSRNGWQKLQALNPQTGEPLPAKKMQSRYSGALKGAAVHLAKPDKQGRLLVAEGIESALAAKALFGIPAVAALSAWGMAAFEWPSGCRELYIAADNDLNRAGITAAYQLAKRANEAGIACHIWQSRLSGYDALNEWNHRQGANDE